MAQDITGNPASVDLSQPVILQIPSPGPGNPAKAGDTVGSGATAQVGLKTMLQRIIDYIKALINRTDTIRTDLNAVITANSDDDGNIVNVQTNLTTHIGNATGAHAASAISHTPNVAAGATATNVETALDDLEARAAALEGLTVVNWSSGFAQEALGIGNFNFATIGVAVPAGKKVVLKKLRFNLEVISNTPSRIAGSINTSNAGASGSQYFMSNDNDDLTPNHVLTDNTSGGTVLKNVWFAINIQVADTISRSSGFSAVLAIVDI